MRVGCIIQARLGSARLPGKVLADIGGWPMIRHVWHRMALVGIPVVIAVPEEDLPEIHAGWPGSQYSAPDCDSTDVLQRYLLTAKQHSFDAIMRVTGDSPLVDPGQCSRVLQLFHAGQYDYVANDLRPSYPKGLGCEVFTREALQRAHENVRAAHPRDREHVTPWIIRGVRGDYFDGRNVRCSIVGVENLNFSVDLPEDLARVRAVDARLPDGANKFSIEATLEAWRQVCEAEERGMRREYPEVLPWPSTILSRINEEFRPKDPSDKG